jgi:hypothetical protein
VALLLSLSVNTHASTKDEKAIKDVEHKMIATTNTDDLMKYYDPNDGTNGGVALVLQRPGKIVDVDEGKIVVKHRTATHFSGAPEHNPRV